MHHPGAAAPGPPRGETGLFLVFFQPILVYFRASRTLPIDSSRRELQNALGEIKIGVFLFFDYFWTPLIVQKASLMVPDGP